MGDWFTPMLREVSDKVITSPETASRLALTDLVNADGLKAAVIDLEDKFGGQFSVNVVTIQEIRDEIKRHEDAALVPENQRLAEAQAGLDVRPSPTGRLRRRPHVSGSTPQSGPKAAALQALFDANSAYDSAKAKVDQSEPIRKLEAGRIEREAELRKLLYSAVTLKVNEIIDGVLEVSYDKDFSYVGPVELADVSAELVTTDSYSKIKHFIDEVRSGAIGVAGPRGSGKTTVLHRFARTIKKDDQVERWGVCVPAPAKYDPREFLLYLFAQLCIEVLGKDEARRLEDNWIIIKPSKRTFPFAWVIVLLVSAMLACCALVVGLRSAGLGESPDRMTDLVIACCSAIVCFSAVVAFFFVIEHVRECIWLFSRSRPLSARHAVFFIVTGRMPGYIRPHADSRTPDVWERGLLKWRYSGLLILVLTGLAGLTAITLFSLLLVGNAPDPGYLAAGGLAIACVIGIILAYITRWFLAMEASYDYWYARPTYLTAAEKWYKRVKLQQSFTTGWSGTVTLGTSSLPVQVQGGSSGNTEVSPLAMSTPEIVEEIKNFTQILRNCRSQEGADRENLPPEQLVPVVIGIDEVDKIENPRDSQEFFNQIKGLFDCSSCIFLVSISDDAMAAFERRGMPFRDAFDSSLSEVVTLPYLSVNEARTLTGMRLLGVQEPVADLLFVLAGGLARDLVRFIRKAVEAKERAEVNQGAEGSRQGKTHLQLDDLALALISYEVDAQKKAILTRAHTLQQCPAKDYLLSWAERHCPESVEPAKYLAELFTQALSLIDSACDGVAHQATRQNETVRIMQNP